MKHLDEQNKFKRFWQDWGADVIPVLLILGCLMGIGLCLAAGGDPTYLWIGLVSGYAASAVCKKR